MTGGDQRIVNVMTVDVEDYFQVSAFEATVPRDRWHCFESRVEATTELMLRILREAEATATFFVLGWIAERHPRLVRNIAEQGHEIASHGYAHRLVYDMTPEEFRDDLRRTRAAIEAAGGGSVRGYRAASYSITTESLWALDVLIEEDYSYDSSIFPIHHDRYGIPGAPRHPHVVERPGGSLVEIPPSTISFAGFNLPVAGGGYFRLLPYAWTAHGIRQLNQVEKRPAVFYLHPWELDPAQPRLPGSWRSRLRHYTNLDRTEERLRALLREFSFASVSAALPLTLSRRRVGASADGGREAAARTEVAVA
jgi:polysaccharide deacetylase family protein (PEP-CTERM system associated)